MKLVWILSLIIKKDSRLLGFFVNKSVSDEKKNNYGDRLISLHHSLGLYIVNSRVGKCDQSDIPCFPTTDVQENSIQK